LHAWLDLGVAWRCRQSVSNRIGADDEIFIRVEGLPGSDHEIDPVVVPRKTLLMVARQHTTFSAKML
jgi:hypothetical protein